MQPDTKRFQHNARQSVEDLNLQKALDGLETGFAARRRIAIDRCPNFERLRDRGQRIRSDTMANLEHHLIHFETSAKQAGSDVHWAGTADQACKIVADLCATAGASSVVKGKSMVTEEIGLNDHLQEKGYDVTETDLGEYLLQTRDETPSHIIAPAIHLTEDDARATFLKTHNNLDPERTLTDAESIVAEARTILRDKFLKADVGITGANFLISETGSAVLVTNEGNGDLTALLPKTHIIVAGIEKIVPTLKDVGVLLELLARSATGQTLTAYTSFLTGPKRDPDLDGPDTCHVVLVDNGRSSLLASQARDVLNCIRCGACLNHCPVYANIGGHAYGWVYPGPIGAALNPGLLGVAETRDLPHASTLCGRCEEVCPVRIPLPKIFRQWRAADYNASRTSTYNVKPFVWGWLAQRPKLYASCTRLAAWALANPMGRAIAGVFAKSWTKHRKLPESQGRTFQSLWQAKDRPSEFQLQRRTRS